MKALAAEGKTIVLVTHDLDFAFATADEVSMLFDGELACTEPVQDFFRQQPDLPPEFGVSFLRANHGRWCSS